MLYSGLHAYSDFLNTFPEEFRLMNAVGNIRRKTKNSPKLQEWLEFDLKLFQSVADVIQIGKKDGTIRKNINPMKGTFSIIFIATGFIRLLADTGENFADHFDLDTEEFSDYTLKLFLDSIKA